ncbi:Tetraspanin-8-like Protein [Tribolium castaneum]|uniref:Tetraspanin n=2 Tax=Tribolium castaneum TaxID=7070 RepID=A0A139WFN0_TRICA|nr:Tetraspanin-8-like Protein [Tribolium castaneum]
MKVFSVQVAILGLNGAILALGVILSYIGITWIQFEIKYEKATENQFVYIGAVLIALGLFLCNTTVMGCCGTLSKNKFLLAINTCMFLLIFVIYADFGIVALHLKKASSPYMKDIDVELEKILRKKHKGWDDFYDYIQKKFKCCGFDGFQDYHRVLNTSHLKSCCKDNSDCKEPTYKEGCTKPLLDYIGEKFVFSGAISFTVAILGLIAGVFTYIVKRLHRSCQFSTSGEL